METSETSQPETPPTSEVETTIKNPWWVKMIPHFFIFYCVVDQICNPKDIINIIFILLWINIGITVKRQKRVISSSSRILFLFSMIILTPHLIINIKMLVIIMPELILRLKILIIILQQLIQLYLPLF